MLITSKKLTSHSFLTIFLNNIYFYSIHLFRLLYGLFNLIIICIIILYDKLINKSNNENMNLLNNNNRKSISFSGGG